MNNEIFQQAKQAFAAHEYAEALRLFSFVLENQGEPLPPGELGLVYHQVGNCLTKQKRYEEAIEAYSRAAADTAYDACGTVNANMGMAYAALREWDGAVKHFEIAVSDRTYPTPYKAYLGMGNALLKQGKSAEAGVAFREAALDEANPDPTKALLNLGVCFMALNRPADAVASYESALQFDMNAATRNKLYASLGQAYAASGRMQEAVEAFERALADRTYFLSDSATIDYQRAIAAVSHGTSEIAAAAPSFAADTSGFDVVAAESEALPGPGLSASLQPIDEKAAQDSGYYFADEFEEGDPSQAHERFFNASEEEIEQWSRGVVKLERKRKSVGLKIFIAILIILLLAVLAAGALYVLGFGFPQQQDAVVADLFANPANAEIYTDDVDEKERAAIADIVQAGSTVAIDGMDKGMKESVIYATATLPKGGEARYKILLKRGPNFVSWKVDDVDLYFASTDGNAVSASASSDAAGADAGTDAKADTSAEATAETAASSTEGEGASEGEAADESAGEGEAADEYAGEETGEETGEEYAEDEGETY